MNEDDFSRLPPAAQAYIRELEARNRQLGARVAQLEEQFRLAQSKRFAPGSEKLRDRVFDEAEQIAATEPDDADTDSAEETFPLPNTGLPDAPVPARQQTWAQAVAGTPATPAHRIRSARRPEALSVLRKRASPHGRRT
jgi:transposase